MKQIAIYCGYFDPPTAHHRHVVEVLKDRFDEFYIIPHDNTRSSSITDSILLHRAAMIDLNFAQLRKTQIDFHYLEQNQTTLPYDLEKRYQTEKDGQIYHVVELADIQLQANGRSRIQNEWVHGDELWERSHFVVLADKGTRFDQSNGPSQFEIVEFPHHLDSETLRSQIFHNESVSGNLHPKVEAYIRRHGLFRGIPPLREMLFHLDKPRFQFFIDERNATSRALRDSLKEYESDDPELIIGIGGDGTMLRAIRESWHQRIPFYGLNTGHLGFLLNNSQNREFWKEDLLLYQLPLLQVQTEGLNGQIKEALAFNDIWVERATGQTAWVEVKVDDIVRLPKAVGDGMLVSTPAGSTSYARAMGATPLPLNTPVLILVGSNLLNPPFWKPAILPLESIVELKTLDANKRPLQCYMDGDSQGLVRSVKIQASRIASVELAFAKSHNPAMKLAMQQFPIEQG